MLYPAGADPMCVIAVDGVLRTPRCAGGLPRSRTGTDWTLRIDARVDEPHPGGSPMSVSELIQVMLMAFVPPSHPR